MKEIEEVGVTLRLGWIIIGSKTKVFDRIIAEYCYINGNVCSNSQTALAKMLLRVQGVSSLLGRAFDI